MTVAPSGELDRAAAESFTEALDDAMEAGVVAITVDLRDIPRLNRYGTHALLIGQLRANDRGVTLSIVPGPPAVQRALDRTGAPFTYRRAS